MVDLIIRVRNLEKELKLVKLEQKEKNNYFKILSYVMRHPREYIKYLKSKNIKDTNSLFNYVENKNKIGGENQD